MRASAGAFGTTFLVQKTDPSDVNTYVMKEVRCRDKDQLIEALREVRPLLQGRGCHPVTGVLYLRWLP